MAGGAAGALLLRAAALGGLTAAAWLLSGTVASASAEEPPPGVETAIEALTEATTLATTPAVTTPAEVTEAPEAAAPDTAAPEPVALKVVDQPTLLEDPAGWATALTTSILDQHQAPPIKHAPIELTPKTPAEEPEYQEPDEGPLLDFSGGSHANQRSGQVSNQAPAEVIQAKAQARAARLAAKAAALLPPPPAPIAIEPIAVKKVQPRLHEVPPVLIQTKTEATPTSEANWSEPGPDSPLPTPQPAPVTATATASSSHSDNSGGTRGVLAVLTSHNSLFPPSTWSVEERCDARSPGSLPGLPSTSPD